jgi:hypothetical protein
MAALAGELIMDYIIVYSKTYFNVVLLDVVQNFGQNSYIVTSSFKRALYKSSFVSMILGIRSIDYCLRVFKVLVDAPCA